MGSRTALEALSVRNFQPHSEVFLQLSPTVTCFVGESDTGKSAFFRALKWSALNQPSGDSFIKWGEECTEVKLILDGGVTITRKKGAGENIYKLGKKVYKSFGQGKVPEEIANLLNLGEMNFANQLDPPFWFLKSPGEVSRELNKIVNLDKIDRVLSKLNTDLRRSQSYVEVSQQRAEEAKKTKDRLAWVPAAEVEIELLGAVLRETQEKSNRIAYTESLIEKGREVLSRHQNAVESVLGASKLISLIDEALDLDEKVERLESLVNGAKWAEENAWQARRDREQASREWQELLSQTETCPLCQQSILPRS